MLPNSRFPLLVYRRGVPGGGEEAVRTRFRENGWLNNGAIPASTPTRISIRPRMSASAAP